MRFYLHNRKWTYLLNVLNLYWNTTKMEWAAGDEDGIYRSETFTNGSSKTSRDRVQKWGKFSNHADYGANRPQHVWSNMATANETGSGWRWIMNMLLAGCCKFRTVNFFLVKSFRWNWKILLWSLVLSFFNRPCRFAESTKQGEHSPMSSASCMAFHAWYYFRITEDMQITITCVWVHAGN